MTSIFVIQIISEPRRQVRMNDVSATVGFKLPRKAVQLH